MAARGAFAGCPGLPGQVGPVLWLGPLDTDHGATAGGIECHAEHLSGPVRGGNWYCQVYRGEAQYFHTAECGIEP